MPSKMSENEKRRQIEIYIECLNLDEETLEKIRSFPLDEQLGTLKVLFKFSAAVESMAARTTVH